MLQSHWPATCHLAALMMIFLELYAKISSSEHQSDKWQDSMIQLPICQTFPTSSVFTYQGVIIVHDLELSEIPRLLKYEEASTVSTQLAQHESQISIKL